MIAPGRVGAPALLTLLACLGAPARAQDTAQARADSLRRVADSILPIPVTLPIVEPEVPAGPLPAGSRYVFTRDSLIWTRAASLGELLGSVPGLYVARGGFLGQPQYPAFAGRGAAAVEIYWDGVPLDALGGDSIYADPAHIPLTYLRRVDVEMLPALIRVYLVSERHELPEARSMVRVVTGQFKTAGYAGLFQKRFTNGIGLNLAADYFSTQGAPGAQRTDRSIDIWGKVEWLPTPLAGAAFQVRRQKVERDPLLATAEAGGGLLTPGRFGTRTDRIFTLFAATAPEGLGFRVAGGLASSAWTNDSLIPDRHLRRAFAAARYRDHRWSAEAGGSAGDGRTPREVITRLGWTPIRAVVLSGDARWRRHEGDRTARRLHVALGLEAGPFSLVGENATQNEPEAPALLGDSLQETTDQALRAGMATRRLSGHVGFIARDFYLPRAFPDLLLIPALAPSTATTFLVADVTLRPVSPLTLDGWYAHPRRGAADFQPPTHGRAQLTFRSKFWRTFRSGAFDLKVQVAMESWSRGTAGISADGNLIELRGITFWDAYLEIQLVGFTAFYSLRNAYRAREEYVPGYPYPRSAQTYGVRWEFGN